MSSETVPPAGFDAGRADGPDYTDYRLSFLLLEFRGRIGRAQFWWGFAVLLLIDLLATLAIAALFGVDVAAYMSGSRASVVVDMIVLAFMTFPSLALATKRLNDRDMGPWLGIMVILLAFFLLTELYFQVPDKLDELDFVALVPAAMAIGAVGWLIFECGLMPAFDAHGDEDEREDIRDER